MIRIYPRRGPLRWCWLILLMMSIALVDEKPAAALELADEEAAIRQVGGDYVDAFNGKDAKKLASFWSPEAVYTNRLTGEEVIGREAISKQFVEIFESGGDAKLEVDIASIEFLTPNVAIEKGSATYVSDAPQQIPYSAVYIKRDGKWLLDRVTDDPQPMVASHYEQLKDLEWMIGSWVDQADGVEIQTDCNWTKNRNFITRAFAVSVEGEVDLSGMQIIGWDAGEKTIRSWTFDSDGGFAQAKWSKNGDAWYVIKKGKTADGKSVSSVNVITYLDDDSFKLKSVQRTLDGQLLPSVGEVMVVRK